MATPGILEQLNSEMADVVIAVRHALVQVHSVGGGNGAGTIWSPYGLIITNAHVVRTPQMMVTLPGARRVPAKVLARDTDLDLALWAWKASAYRS